MPCDAMRSFATVTGNARTHTHVLTHVYIFMGDAACENCEGYADTRRKDHKGRRRRRCRCDRTKAGADFERTEKSSTCLSTGDLQSPSMVARIGRTRGHVFSLLLSSATFPFFFFIVVFTTLRVGLREEFSRGKTGGLKSEKQRELVGNGIL